MSDLETKMGTILNDPEMMQKIMALAQTLNQSDAAPKQDAPPSPKPEQSSASALENAGFPLQGLDLSMIQKLSGFAKQSSIDKNQQALLRALHPYLSRERIVKLEKAMRAAKMATMASSFLGTTGLQSLLGR